MPERGHVLNVRLSDEETEMVRAVAEAMGLKQSDAIRQLVRRAHDELAPAKAKRKRK